MTTVKSSCAGVAVAWVIVIGVVCGSAARAAEPSVADQTLATGWRAFDRGDFESALDLWRRSQQLFQQSGRVDGQIDSLRNRAAALREVGSYAMAWDQLQQALQLAIASDDQPRLMEVYQDQGVVATLTHDPRAGQYFQKSLDIARALGDSRGQASIYNNLANHYWVEQRFMKHDDASLADPEASPLHAYLQSAQQAGLAQDDALLARAWINAAMAAMASSDQPTTNAAQLIPQARAAVQRLEPNHEQAFLFVSIGHAYLELTRRHAAAFDRDQAVTAAFDAYRSGLKVATGLGDQRVVCYALEGIAQLYELESRTDDALRVAYQGVSLAQQTGLSNLLYRFQWQIGRLLRDQGNDAQAIDAYRQAVAYLGVIQPQIALGAGNRRPGSSFRRQAGPLFSQFADLLVQRAQVADDPQTAQRLMRQAIEAVERFKTAELADYFQDQCIQQLLDRSTTVAGIASHTAVIYLMPLADRTEILVDIGGQLSRHTAPVDRAGLDQEVDRFRHELGDASNQAQLTHARQLYDWLIAPIDDQLQAQEIQTLVFVPDGSLRSVPMAALHDGDGYLIERYATAVTPGLTLTDPKPLRARPDPPVGLRVDRPGGSPAPTLRAHGA